MSMQCIPPKLFFYFDGCHISYARTIQLSHEGQFFIIIWLFIYSFFTSFITLLFILYLFRCADGVSFLIYVHVQFHWAGFQKEVDLIENGPTASYVWD